jgi:diamine N-acetyltransferase
MNLLENEHVKLRSLEPTDLDLLFSIENDSQYWDVSNTLTPFSRDVLSKYLKNAHQDIYEAKQLRLVITRKSDSLVVGLIDLFDFNPQHERAGIGILILKNFQRQGYAQSTLELFLNYAFEQLDLQQLYADIPADNKSSLALFNKMNFKKIGIKKSWIKVKGKFKDVVILQILNPKLR